MSLWSYLIPHTLFRTSSRYNQDIRVIEEWGKRRLLVNGSRQSGPTIQELWVRAMEAFPLADLPKRPSLLVLGVGGGTVMGLLAERIFEPRITAVDIDPAIIAIAKRYFGLDSLPHMHLVVNDAKKFIQSAPGHAYDLVVIDLFIGRIIPDFVASPSFYQSLKRCLKPRGIILINYLWEHEYQHKSDALKEILQRIFHDVADFAISNNRFFFAHARFDPSRLDEADSARRA